MHTVSLPKKNKTFQIEDNAILFDSLEDQGETLPHGCLAGSCGACRIEVFAGAENLSKVSMIEENTVMAIKDNYKRIHGEALSEERVVRLSCRAKVCGDVSIAPLD